MMAMKKGLYAAIALVAVLGTTLWVWVMQPLESSATAPTVLVEIPRGSSVADIARILRNKGIVRRRKAFAAAVLLSGSYGRRSRQGGLGPSDNPRGQHVAPDRPSPRKDKDLQRR